MKSSDYIQFAINKLEKLKETQSDNIDQAAQLIANAC